MAIQVSVQNRFQIVVPTRFDRAVRGVPVLDAPDIDDRGWERATTVGLNVSDARGALFSATVGDVIRLKVEREDIDSSTPLFLTVTGNQVKIEEPAGGGPLPADGIFKVKAVADTTAGSKVQVRMGSTGGAVIGEIDAHTFTPKTLSITPHVCTIHSADAATVAAGGGTGAPPSINGAVLDDAGVIDLFETFVRPIWRPAGIEFNLGAVRTATFTGTDGFTRDNVPLSGTNQLATVFARNRQANSCNIFFIHTGDGFLGLGLNFEARAIEGANNSGIALAVNGFLDSGTFTARFSSGADLVHEIGNDIAHEIGHFLNLEHADNAQNPNEREDSYNRRFLMHPNNPLPQKAAPPALPRFDDVGYGTINVSVAGAVVVLGHRGCLLTLKDHKSHTSDGEIVATRRRFQSPNLVR